MTSSDRETRDPGAPSATKPAVFEEDPPREAASRSGEDLVLDLEGFEGPIDVLLQLARDQKVDITRISILELAEQYLAFVRAARRLRLELAADYLVMAAWLAYLKSRLLLPEPQSDGEEPSGAEMAAALRFQLQRLEAMQNAGKELLGRPQLGSHRLPRGAPEEMPVRTRVNYDCSLYDLLRAYATQHEKVKVTSLRIDPFDLLSVEQALARLRRLLGIQARDWADLMTFLPSDLKPGLPRRAALAATFSASLELCREGALQVRQDHTYGPVYLRRNQEDEGEDRGSQREEQS